MSWGAKRGQNWGVATLRKIVASFFYYLHHVIDKSDKSDKSDVAAGLSRPLTEYKEPDPITEMRFLQQAG